MSLGVSRVVWNQVISHVVANALFISHVVANAMFISHVVANAMFVSHVVTNAMLWHKNMLWEVSGRLPCCGKMVVACHVVAR